MYDLKLSLGLLFGISNILSLGWDNSRTHLYKKKIETRKKIKSQKYGFLKKKSFCQK